MTSYEDWANTHAGRSTGAAGVGGGGNESGLDSDNDEDKDVGRSSKRCRTGGETQLDLVCYIFIPSDRFYVPCIE